MTVLESISQELFLPVRKIRLGAQRRKYFFFAQSRPALPNIKNLRIRIYHLKTDRTNENYYKDRI